MTKIKQLKLELKDLALQIRTLKASRKSMPNGFVPGLYFACSNYRLKHIAYCLLRGKVYEQIERKTSDEKTLSEHEWKRINAFIADYTEEVAIEAVSNC